MRMMNHDLVPDFGVEDEYCIATTSSGPTKSSMADEELMEMLWKNGEVGQNQMNQKKLSPLRSQAVLSFAAVAPAPQPDDASANHNLFIQEDEMASWLHYPLEDTSFDHDFFSGYFYPSAAAAPSDTTAATTAALVAELELRPPLMLISTKPSHTLVSPVKVSTDGNTNSVLNFGYFSRMQGRDETPQSVSNNVVKETIVLDPGQWASVGFADVAATTSAGGEKAMSSTSSSGGRGSGCVSVEPTQKPTLNEDRKRKVREGTYNTNYCSEDVLYEPADPKKEVHASPPAKRSRAAEVHNRSERRRRDRINARIKVLQELTPRCTKTDKASMLDDVITYMKSLQLQLQMMSMGCSMVPMMYPGMQQYMVPMEMKMGMDMSVSHRPMISYPPVLAGSAAPTPSAAARMGPRYPIPGYNMQPVPPSDSSRIQANYQLNPLAAAQSHNQQQLPFTNPYPHYYGVPQIQSFAPKNQATAKPSTSKTSTNCGAERREHPESG